MQANFDHQEETIVWCGEEYPGGLCQDCGRAVFIMRDGFFQLNMDVLFSHDEESLAHICCDEKDVNMDSEEDDVHSNITEMENAQSPQVLTSDEEDDDVCSNITELDSPDLTMSCDEDARSDITEQDDDEVTYLFTSKKEWVEDKAKFTAEYPTPDVKEVDCIDLTIN